MNLHNKEMQQAEAQIKISELLYEALDLKWYQFIKGTRLIQQAKDLAKKHNIKDLDL